MLISEDISRCEGGALYLDMRPQVDVQLKFSSWHDGLQLYRYESQDWQHDRYDPGLILVNDLYPPKTPAADFASRVPTDIRQAVQPFQHFQTTMLQWASVYPFARDLLFTNPVLLWLAACHSPEEINPVDILGKKQSEILKALYGTGSESKVRFLKKIQIENGNEEALFIIQKALQSPDMPAVFRHWKKIPIPALAVAERHPLLRQSPFLRNVAENEFDLYQAYAEAEKLIRIWPDIKRMGRQLEISNLPGILKKVYTYRDLESIHDRWVQKLNRRMAERIKNNEIDPSQMFPFPPLEGTESIVPITNALELALESNAMRHCVVSYEVKIRKGLSYIYRIMEPERATLEIGFTSDGDCKIIQLKTFANGNPSGQTWEHVQQWLKNHQTN